MTEHRFLAIYFCMGQHEEGDNVPPEQVGFDCPFDDSPILYARNEEELEHKIKQAYEGESDIEGDWEGIYPNLICDSQGHILVDLYRRITQYQDFDPTTEKYSFDRETLTQLWEREKWRWV